MTAADWLREIIAAPESDDLRLKFADWLEERGETARSEFIRVQVRLARPHVYCDCGQLPGHHLPNCAYGQWEKERWALVCRERDLLEDHAMHPAWFGWCQRFGRYSLGCTGSQVGVQREDGPMWFGLRRGFVSSLTCTAAAWLAHADALSAAAPIVSVKLTTWPPNEGGFRDEVMSVRAYRDGRASEWHSSEWPHITFTLPEYGPSPLREAVNAMLQAVESTRADAGSPRRP